MFVTNLHGPVLALTSLFYMLGSQSTGSEQPPAPPPAPAIVEGVGPTVTPIVDLAAPTDEALDAAPSTDVPAATTSVVVRVLPPEAIPSFETTLAARSIGPPAEAVAPSGSTQPSATPTPSPTPRIYPTNREVGIIRPDSTPTPSPYTGQTLSSAVPRPIRRWENEILAAAQRYRLDPNLIAALMQTESQGVPGAVSQSNAVGLLQVIDGPSDPQANVMAGTKMLAHHLELFDQDLELALAAYNAGPRNVLNYKGVPPFAETQTHIARTLASYERFRRTH